MQRDIVRIAEEHDLIVFCDEVFYPLFRLPDSDRPRSFSRSGIWKDGHHRVPQQGLQSCRNQDWVDRIN
ncbi:hypothetical protein BDV38DRAFT_246014 [Aspergillus pseudotamarii]|uniref:Uncharacterized protein n=1 Tax=Aspergillus pseudotamarii TaxID=132259 RepID=A0A5N6SW38_ASPPS|nr:uncharacterized protein BDV38DRAFT_246014 [Aspergillus pseudotamarii]KAE8137991.1 hypothetical protein BDV38DRAFT_246014 [Aspergillus pseudotamarii]